VQTTAMGNACCGAPQARTMAGESEDKFFIIEPGDPVFEKRLESLRKRCSGKPKPELVKALVKAAGNVATAEREIKKPSLYKRYKDVNIRISN
jgi:hypothetical protein